jgi:hypothetical protein
MEIMRAPTNTHQVTFKEGATDAERNEAKAKAQAASVDPKKPLDEYNIGSFKGFRYVPPYLPSPPYPPPSRYQANNQIVSICPMTTYPPLMSTAMLQ